MTLKTLKPKVNNSLILDDEFLQYCKLNNIEDVQKLARETFKRGFDILKYGDIPPIVLSPSSRKYQSDTIIPVIPMSSPTGIQEIIRIEKKMEKNDLYDE